MNYHLMTDFEQVDDEINIDAVMKQFNSKT
jgi:hypothetical protein